MAFDIYGNHLRPGYCEVHPDVRESYPCSECVGDYQPEPRQPEPTAEDMCDHSYHGEDEDGARCFCGKKRYAFCLSCNNLMPEEENFCASCKKTVKNDELTKDEKRKVEETVEARLRKAIQEVEK